MPPKISESEWRIMRLFWEKSPRTANEVVEKLQGTVEWNRQTIRTLINRLVNKKALGHQKEGRQFLYFAKVTEPDCQKSENQSFLSRVYNGAMQPMLAAFIEDQNLSDEEIDSLERLLKEKRRSK